LTRSKRPDRRRARSLVKRVAAARKPRRLAPFSPEQAERWFADKTFTADWTSWHFPTWVKLFGKYRGRAPRILEIGSWEGRSTLFFLNFMPRARLTCIDTFAGGQEHREAAERDPDEARSLKKLERRFDDNTREFRRRIEKIKAQSGEALAALAVARRRFDLAYIDGGHKAVEAYADGALTWPLMARGGIVLFDDYQWAEMPEPLDNPKAGIDAFLKSIAGQYRLVHKRYQIAIVKR
jgi:predicted O-methyltransferase YrrM